MKTAVARTICRHAKESRRLWCLGGCGAMADSSSQGMTHTTTAEPSTRCAYGKPPPPSPTLERRGSISSNSTSCPRHDAGCGCRDVPEGHSVLTEGKASILHHGTSVFYNPVQARRDTCRPVTSSVLMLDASVSAGANDDISVRKCLGILGRGKCCFNHFLSSLAPCCLTTARLCRWSTGICRWLCCDTSWSSVSGSWTPVHIKIGRAGLQRRLQHGSHKQRMARM